MQSSHQSIKPFLRLVRHFLIRLVRSGHETETEFEFGAGPLLGVLSAPGSCYAFLLFQKYSSLADWIRGRRPPNIYNFSEPDKFFFIGLAMGVAGVLTALKWDRILPDAQDYLNLSPLPVRQRSILLANAAAVGFAVSVVAVTMNGVSALLFPLEVASYGHLGTLAILRFIAAHIICLTLASLFMFSVILALLGTLAATLSRAMFRASSSWVRGAVLIGAIVLFVAGAVVPRGAHTIGRFYPPLWFLSLYQQMEGHVTADMEPFTGIALPAFGAALVWVIAAYALGYRRSFAGVLEGGKPPRKQPVARVALAFLDLFGARAAAFERACHRFILRAMLRSEAHRMCISVAVGLGWLLGMQQAIASDQATRLEAPFTVAFLLILGLRIAFELPAGVASNWMFRAALDPRANPMLGAPRRVIVSLLVPVVLAPAFALAWRDMGPFAAALHTMVVLALSLSLGEIMLTGYRKIPLTCPLPPFGDKFLPLCVIQIVAFALFVQLGGRLDGWLLRKPWYFPVVPLTMAAAVWWNRQRIAQARVDGELDETLVFENAAPVAVTRLDLFDGG
jgi:hypothetical protein